VSSDAASRSRAVVACGGLCLYEEPGARVHTHTGRCCSDPTASIGGIKHRAAVCGSRRCRNTQQAARASAEAARADDRWA
jgi:hypothetical protein